MHDERPSLVTGAIVRQPVRDDLHPGTAVIYVRTAQSVVSITDPRLVYVVVAFLGTAVSGFYLSWHPKVPWASMLGLLRQHAYEQGPLSAYPYTWDRPVADRVPKLTRVVEYLPYPVTAGMLASIGVSLVKSGVRVAAFGGWRMNDASGALLVAFAGAVVMRWIERKAPPFMATPIVMIAGADTVRLYMWLADQSHADAHRKGLVFAWDASMLANARCWFAWTLPLRRRLVVCALTIRVHLEDSGVDLPMHRVLRAGGRCKPPLAGGKRYLRSARS